MASWFGATTEWGHTSGDKYADHGNYANRIEFDIDDSNEEDLARAARCFAPWSSNECEWNRPNVEASVATLGAVGGLCTFVQSGGYIDDHWDGAFDGVRPTCGARWFGLGAQVAACVPTLIDYFVEVCDQGFYHEGVPRYDFARDLEDVGYPHFHYLDSDKWNVDPDQVGQLRPADSSRGSTRIVGPTVAVMGVKTAEDINGLRGLGLENEYNISAYSRAQVYYLRNPNRPDETPSLFNPHWAARLAPVDEDDSHFLLRYGLPYVTGMGVPIDPTH